MQLIKNTPSSNIGLLFTKLLKVQNYTTEKNTLQLFELKCINNLLPVLVVLNKRKPDVYYSTTCIVCKEKNETVEHLVSCKVSINLLRDLEECAVKLSL